jgi:hypothetical protein
MRLATLGQSLAKQFAGLAVPHLSIRGGTFTVHDGEGNKKIISKMDEDGRVYCRALIVDGNPYKSKVYYGEKFSDNEDDWKPPTCYSEDGEYPAANVESKQSETCASCQWNVWGSAISAMGKQVKACRDFIKIAVVIPDMGLDKIFLLRIPPASTKAFVAYSVQLQDMRINGRPGNVGDVVTYIAFVPGEQGMLEFFAGEFENEEEKLIAPAVQESNQALMLLGLHNVHPSLALEAPTQKKMIEAKPEQKKIAKQIIKEVAEEVEEEIEVEEVSTTSKKKFAAPKVNMQGMRTKMGDTISEQPHKAPTTGTPSGIPNTKMPEKLAGMMSSIMKMNTGG